MYGYSMVCICNVQISHAEELPKGLDWLSFNLFVHPLPLQHGWLEHTPSLPCSMAAGCIFFYSKYQSSNQTRCPSVFLIMMNHHQCYPYHDQPLSSPSSLTIIDHSKPIGVNQSQPLARPWVSPLPCWGCSLGKRAAPKQVERSRVGGSH